MKRPIQKNQKTDLTQWSLSLRELVTSTTVICNTRTRVEGRSELHLHPPFPANPEDPEDWPENSQMLIGKGGPYLNMGAQGTSGQPKESQKTSQI